MADPLFYIRKPENKIPNFLKTYSVHRATHDTKHMSDLLSDDIINTDNRNADLSKLYYKNI